MENENEVALPSDTYDLSYMLGEKSDDREAYEYTYTAIANASTVASDGSITWTGSLSKNLTSGIGWKLGKKWLYKEIDEIKCAGVCALPAAYDKSYCLAWSSEGQWYNKSNSQVVNYNNSKAAIVYKKIGDVEDKFYYLPVTYGDAKAHTFPGGDTVKQGDVIAYVGNTGQSSGAHLHIAVKVNGVLKDPELYLIIPQ